MSGLANLVYIVIQIEVFLIIARVLISWFPSVDYGSPAVRALRTLTDPVLRVFRPILPTFSGIDVTPLLAIVVLRAVGTVFNEIAAGVAPDPAQFVVWVIREVVLAVIVILAIIVFLRVVVGFLHADPWHPATRMVRDMSRPVVAPFESVGARSRQADVPAIIAFVVLVVAYVVIRRVFDELIVRI